MPLSNCWPHTVFPEEYSDAAVSPSGSKGTIRILRTYNWNPDIRNTLNKLLAEVDSPRPSPLRAAIFDFDDTCIFRDVGRAVFLRQLEKFNFRLHPDAFVHLIAGEVQSIGGCPADTVLADLFHLYRRIWEDFCQNSPVENEIRSTEHERFITLFLWYVHEARKEKNLGAAYIFPLLARIMAGYSVDEVEKFTHQVLREVMAEPISCHTRSADFMGRPEGIQVQHTTGLQVFVEMVDLMHCLVHSGISCYIISASNQWVVETAAHLLGFPVDRKNIFGIRVEIDKNQRLLTTTPPHYPVTYRAGKKWVINNLIDEKPVLVAGDAETDYEMLTMAGVPFRLILNHNRKDLISTLYTNPEYLVQKIDRHLGSFQASSFSSSTA